MIATVRLDNGLEEILYQLTHSLHKKKSEIIRESIRFYANNINNTKKSKILNAVQKTKDIDKKEFQDFEVANSDGL